MCMTGGGSLGQARTLVKNSEVAGTLPRVREYPLPRSVMRRELDRNMADFLV